MNMEIWKFVIDFNQTVIEMPKDAKILSVQVQHGKPCIWALVNPDNEKQLRNFVMYGTGHIIMQYKDSDLNYIGTVQLESGLLVIHLFEHNLNQPTH